MDMQNFKMPRVVPLPWEFVQDFLDEKKLSQRKLAKIIDKTPTEINEIIKGKKRISPDFAMRFSIVFETSPELWLDLQNIYDLYQLRKLQGKKTAFAAIKKRSLALA